jgi:hypothetical protein
VIDEQVLERALRAEAATYAVPAHGPDDVRAAVAATVRRRPRRAVWVAGAAAVAAVAVVVASLGGADGFVRRTSTSAFDSAEGKSAGGSRAPLAYLDEDSRGGLVQPGGSAQPAIVRTGDVSVEVADVPRALAELARIASSRRGFVAASSSDGTPDSPSGSVTLRVPVADFDAVVAEAGRLGTVTSSRTSGTDVTAEVTDTAARLKTLVAARAQLEALLAQAKTVGEVLAVQERLTETQTQIEQAQARQKSLADRTTYGTVNVEVHEEGAYETGRTGFSKAWHDAVDGFVSAAQGLVAASGTIAFVLLALGALLLLLRPFYRALVRRVL